MSGLRELLPYQQFIKKLTLMTPGYKSITAHTLKDREGLRRLKKMLAEMARKEGA